MAHRIGARVAGLSPAKLCAIIEAQAVASDAALRVADEHATRLVEQPEWILSEVLLSPDLVPHILAQLPTKEHAAKATCRAWRRGWKETLKTRERPRLTVFGGIGGDGEFIHSLERYDPVENAWDGEEAVAPTLPVQIDPTLALLEGKLYAVGGSVWNDGDVEQPDYFPPSDRAERYDLETKTWEAVAPMTVARWAAGVAVLGGRLYAVGGHSDDEDLPAGSLTSVERYDPALDAWEAVAPMPTGRTGLGVAVLDGKLYAVGGSGEFFESIGAVERYDPATNSWEAVAPMSTSRGALGTAVLDGKLYAVGGYSSDPHGDLRVELSSTERYDPAANAWEAVAPLGAPRRDFGLAVVEGRLYAVGGVDLAVLEGGLFAKRSSVERYDPALNAWEAVAPMATARECSLAVSM